MIHRLMLKPYLSDKYSQSCTNLKYPHFNTERMRQSSMVVSRILYLFNCRCLWYCTRSSNASWTTLARKVPWFMVWMWSCVYRMVGGVVCLPKKCRCGSAKKSNFVGGGPLSLLSVSYLQCMVSEYNKGISTKSNELEWMMQRAAFCGINRYYLQIQRNI
jgi:hypothetical protein